jgi:hypothetical protein
MFEKIRPGEVALCTDLLAYRPKSTKDQSNILVGTPTALESALSKVRGKVGGERKRGTATDFSQIAGGFKFHYAVYDEVLASNKSVQFIWMFTFLNLRCIP